MEELVAQALSKSRSIVTSCYHSSLGELKDLSDLKTGIIISSLPVNPVQLALWARADAIFPGASTPGSSRRHIKVIYRFTPGLSIAEIWQAGSCDSAQTAW